MMSNNIKILICTHKQFKYIADDSFLPIHVGKSISHFDLPYHSDSQGDNISLKNKNYCELTALYWAWKNLVEIEYIGLCHYRRFFNFSKTNKYRTVEEITEVYFEANFRDYIFDKQHLIDFDIILAKPIFLNKSLAEDYIHNHIREDFEILRNTVYELFPEYKKSFIEIMDNNNKLYPFNMFVANRNVFLQYNKWLFAILNELEKKVYISKYPYQERIFGFMAERLLNVFVFHNNLKINFLPVSFIGSDVISVPKYKSKLSNIINSAMYDLDNLLYQSKKR